MSDRNEVVCSSDDGSAAMADAEPSVHVPDHSIQQLACEIQPLTVHVLEETPQESAHETHLTVQCRQYHT